MKKFFTFLMALILLVSSGMGSLFSYADGPITSNTDIIITSHNGFNNTFNEREQGDFNLTFTLENRSDTDLNDIYVQFEDNDSFKPKREGSKIALPGSLEAKGKIEINNNNNFRKYIELSYTGGSTSKIPITIFYKKGGVELSTMEYIGVNIKPYKEPIKPIPEDTSKYRPVIGVSGSTTSNIKAGDKEKISFSIVNNSEHIAENITIKANILDGDSPFTIENLNVGEFISKIRSNGKSSFDLTIDTDIRAKDKNYPITLSYQFYNRNGDLFTSEETVYIKITNNSTSPKLHIESVNLPVKDIKPGDKINIGFFIKNTGSLDAKDINLSLQGLKNDGFSIVNMTNQKYESSLAGNKSVYISYDLKVSDKIESGTHNLDLNIKYKDTSNNTIEDTYQVFLNAKGKDIKSSNLLIDNIQSPKWEMSVGEDFKVNFDLINNGDGEARNIKISLDMDKEIIPKSSSIFKVQSLKSNETKSFEFTLSSTNDAITKNYPITINVEYEDDIKKAEKQVLNQYVGVYVEKEEEEEEQEINKSMPKIIIDQYNFDPHIVRAGENFGLNVSFLNTNRYKSVQNIKIFLTVNEESEKSGNVFTPVNSSNTFYIDHIPPKSRVSQYIEMYTVPDAKPKTYTITANFEYEDSEGEEYTATELIGIPVIQQSKLETTEISMPPEGFIGQPIPISIEFYNMGKVTLNNLMIKTEGNFEIEDSNYFVGNFDAGSSEYYDTMIIPTEAGLLEGNIIFTYEDSNGESIEVLKDFSINVTEMDFEEFPPDDFDNIDDNMGEGNSFMRLLKNKILWSIIVIALGVGSFIFLRKRHSIKKDMYLDE